MYPLTHQGQDTGSEIRHSSEIWADQRQGKSDGIHRSHPTLCWSDPRNPNVRVRSTSAGLNTLSLSLTLARAGLNTLSLSLTLARAGLNTLSLSLAHSGLVYDWSLGEHLPATRHRLGWGLSFGLSWFRGQKAASSGTSVPT